MSTLKEQQDAIDALRLQRGLQSDKLYSLQIQLNATKVLLSQVNRNETSLPVDLQQIASLRAQIERLNAQLRDLDVAFNDIADFFARIKMNEQNISFLQKKIEVVSAQLTDDLQKLDEEEAKDPPDNKIVAALTKEIDQLEKL